MWFASVGGYRGSDADPTGRWKHRDDQRRLTKKGAFMAPETFKKRQKEFARREKQKKKLERRIARKGEKGSGGPPMDDVNPLLQELAMIGPMDSQES